jgi:hypothetical protein
MEALLSDFACSLRSNLGAKAISGSRVEWSAPNGGGFVSVDPTPAITIRRHHVFATVSVVQRIHAGTPRDARRLARTLSSQAVLGMIVPGRASAASVDIVSRLRIGRAEVSDLDAYERVLTSAALCHHALALAAVPGGQSSAVPRQDEACRWTSNDFLDLAVHLRDMSTRTMFGSTYVKASLPSCLHRLPGVAANPDVQLSVQSQCRHPSVGNGVIASVGFATSYKGSALEALADRLNRVELAQFTTPPVFGSWVAAHGSARVRFFSFWPNASYVPGLHLQVCAWMIQRAESLPVLLGRAATSDRGLARC